MNQKTKKFKIKTLKEGEGYNSYIRLLNDTDCFYPPYRGEPPSILGWQDENFDDEERELLELQP